MTEPAVASSDATNMQARAELIGDEVVLNSQKWWTSGAGDPRCRFPRRAEFLAWCRGVMTV